MAISETPRTDAKERESEKCDPKMHAHYGWKFARQLERELASLRRGDSVVVSRAELEASREALREYGHHKPGCLDPVRNCNCGLNAALDTK